MPCCPRLPASQAVTVGLYHAVDANCSLEAAQKAISGQSCLGYKVSVTTDLMKSGVLAVQLQTWKL
jgi:hypothetical protein